jgi:hypothetical protein
MSATSAVDAPVAMLRVYCTCPGVSAMMYFRDGVVKYRYATSMVMPCSRSALSPSVKSEKSISSPVAPASWMAPLALARTDASWSS